MTSRNDTPDRSKANEALHAIGRLMAESIDASGFDWETVSLGYGIGLAQAKAYSAYAFNAEGKPRSLTMTNVERVFEQCEALRAALAAKDGQPFSSALFELARDGMSLEARFDFEDVSRFVVTPDTMGWKPVTLRIKSR
ncbi:MAG: hypothetical protein KDI98_01365 [Hyphomicrobiaceae bacterium]|nr:hypothetical protein [Hyphomicrobiaceae bacterium]